MVYKLNSSLPPQEARTHALSILCLSNGIVALRSFGTAISQRDVEQLIASNIGEMIQSVKAAGQ